MPEPTGQHPEGSRGGWLAHRPGTVPAPHPAAPGPHPAAPGPRRVPVPRPRALVPRALLQANSNSTEAASTARNTGCSYPPIRLWPSAAPVNATALSASQPVLVTTQWACQASPEVHPAPGAGRQRGQPVNGQVPALGQVRREQQQPHDDGAVCRGRDPGPGQHPVGAPPERGVGGQIRRRPAKQRPAPLGLASGLRLCRHRIHLAFGIAARPRSPAPAPAAGQPRSARHPGCRPRPGTSGRPARGSTPPGRTDRAR